MRKLLNAAVVGILVASAVWLASCESTRTPATPSRTEVSRASSLGVADSAPTPIVAWHCLAAGTTWQAADCIANIAPVRLSTRSVALSAPNAPSNLTGGVSSGRVTLTWQAPAGGDAPTSYVVEAGSASGRSDLANFDTGTSAPGLVAENVPAGTYFIRVRAKNSAGVSGASNELALIVLGAGGCPPAAPTNLLVAASGFSATLTWSAPGGGCVPTGYIIEAGSTPGASNLANFNTGTTATSYTANGVGAGTYYVRVRATNAVGASAASNEATLVVSGGGCSAPPPAPSLLTGSVSGSTVSLAWTSASGATSYIVEAGTGPGLTNVGVFDEGQSTTLTATAGNGTYYVRVRAANACGRSAPTNEVVVTVGTPAPTCSYTVSPTTQTAANAGASGTITVTAPAGCSWSAGSNASFITINGGASGSGSGTVTYTVAANPGSTSRTGTLTVAGQTVTITQSSAAECTYTLSPSSITFDAAGGNATIGVTASSPTCSWTVQSLAGWIVVTGSASGTGNGSVAISVQSNSGTSRADSVVLGPQAVRVNEAAPLPQLTRASGCASGGQSLQEDTTIQFINTTGSPLTITDGGQSLTVAANAGRDQPTKVGTIWAVFSGSNCVGNYTAASGGRSAVVQ